MTQQGNCRWTVKHPGLSIKVHHQNGSPGEGVALCLECLTKLVIGATVNDLQLGETAFQFTQLRETLTEGTTPIKDQL